MESSIKKAVWMRVAMIFVVVIISGAATITGLRQVKALSRATASATEVHTVALAAEKAHFSWIENLSSAISFGTDFTGSTDYTACDLGKWLYNTDRSTIDSQLSSLMDQIIPGLLGIGAIQLQNLCGRTVDGLVDCLWCGCV